MSGDDRELARDRRLMALRWFAVGAEDLREHIPPEPEA